MAKPYLVGITGGSGSGKTFILNQLVKTFSEEEICMVSQDNYYRDRSLQPKDENGIENFDLPESVSLDEFAKDLADLKSGKEIRRQEYTFNNKDKTPETIVWKPRPIIIVEGLFILSQKEIREMLDLKVYIDVKDYIKLKRRIVRDRIERGYDLEDVLYRYEKHVMPTYEKYIKAHKDDADLILNNHGKDSAKKALEVLNGFLKSKVRSAALAE